MQFQTEGAYLPSVQQQELDALRLPPGERITIHMVHLNHLDLTWGWRLPDSIEMSLETIRWHVDLVEQHPDARYSHTQVLILRIVEELDPPLFARFARLVKQGRIDINGGQVVEPDHNLPSGESLVRQFLYGQRYLQRRFGLRARTLVNSDSFGHCRSLPQIMRKAGIAHMIFKRPRQRYVNLPEIPFHWEGIDGTAIPALRFINKGAGLPSLSQYYDLPPGVTDLQEKVNRNLAAGVHHLFGSHCNSDAGGVTSYVSPLEGKQYRLIYSTPTTFFESALAEARPLPQLPALFNYVYQGCYTTHIEEKEHCRRAERELREVEALWNLAALAGHGYPCEQVTALWWRLCYLQFHDILPGTGSPEAHADSAAHYHELFLGANLLRRRAQLLLDRFCPRTGALRSLLVMNPRPYRCGGIATADVEMPIHRDSRGSEQIPKSGVLADGAGRLTPYQVVETREYQRYVRGTMLFFADDIPALALKVYHLQPGEAPPSTVHASGSVVENEHLRLEIGGPGIIRSIKSKPDGREWLAPVEAPVRIELWPETDYVYDYGGPLKAWGLGITDAREPAALSAEPAVIENGPVRATVRTEHRWGQSRFTSDVSLYAGQPWVELRIEMDWQELEVLARLCIQPALKGPLRRAYGIPLGCEIATGQELEVPAVGWADISGDDGGMALLNRDRPGHTFRDNALRVSLVRCATGDYDPRTDSGIIRATLRLLPHAGSLEDAEIPQRSDEFTCPPLAWQSEAAGEPGASASEPLLVEGAGVLLSGWKVAEAGDGYVLRLWECLGKPAEARLVLGPSLAGSQVLEVNLLEDEIKALPVSDHAVPLSFSPFEIKTLLIRTAQPVLEVSPSLKGSLFAR